MSNPPTPSDVHAVVAEHLANLPKRPVQFDSPPEAVIEQVGRWTWRVHICRGISSSGEWHVLGRRRAEKKARRELGRYLTRERWRRDVHVIADPGA